jgi:hypothetical protein
MTLMAHVGSRKIGLRYFALCIGDKAVKLKKGRPLPGQRNPPKEMEISAYRYGFEISVFFFYSRATL